MRTAPRRSKSSVYANYAYFAESSSSCSCWICCTVWLMCFFSVDSNTDLDPGKCRFWPYYTFALWMRCSTSHLRFLRMTKISGLSWERKWKKKSSLNSSYSVLKFTWPSPEVYSLSFLRATIRRWGWKRLGLAACFLGEIGEPMILTGFD